MARQSTVELLMYWIVTAFQGLKGVYENAEQDKSGSGDGAIDDAVDQRSSKEPPPIPESAKPLMKQIGNKVNKAMGSVHESCRVC